MDRLRLAWVAVVVVYVVLLAVPVILSMVAVPAAFAR
jgi:hypothetical protein